MLEQFAVLLRPAAQLSTEVLAATRNAGVDIVAGADLLEILGKTMIWQENSAQQFQAIA